VLNSSNSDAAAKLRILGVDPEVSFAGGETRVLGLTSELVRRGHRAELLCDPSGELSRRAAVAGIRCHPLSIRNALDIRAGLRIRRLLATESFDVVHFHTSRAHAMAPFARGYAHRLVVTRRMDYTLRGIFSPWLYNRAVDSVAAISQGVAKALVSSGVASDRITLVPSGVDVDLFCPPTYLMRSRRSRRMLPPKRKLQRAKRASS
jgi:glycosyltransferase involved in cell wall biosynthesis